MTFLTATSWRHALLPMLVAASATAAPTTDTPSREAESGSTRAGALPDISGTSEGQGNSKTIRMLLEMQNAPPPLEGTADSRRDGKPKPAIRATEEVLSGPAATPPANVVDWRAGLPGRTVNSQSAGETSSTVIGREAAPGGRPNRQLADDNIDVKAMLPARVVAFLRENREWVLAGSVGLLGLVWLAASSLSQRRR